MMFRKSKYLLIGCIVVTVLIPPLFIQLNEPTLRLNLFKLLAKLGSLAGTTLMLWQFLLGFRGVISRLFIPDLMWVLGLHKKIGTYILALIMLHPIFITLYYLDKFDKNLLMPASPGAFEIFVVLGIIALVLIVMVVLSSVYRKYIKNYALWYSMHLSTYILLPLVFIHSIAVGSTVGNTGLKYIWWCLAVVLVVFYLYRVGIRFGFFVKRHTVIDVKKETPEVTRITMRPLNGKVEPRTGQFIFLRWGKGRSARPFTVSHYNAETGDLSVTVKSLGKTTSLLQGIVPGETVFIEGPYGVFTHAALKSPRPLVMIAGGIGITPFCRLFDELGHKPGREVHLFYGNKFTHEIV